MALRILELAFGRGQKRASGRRAIASNSEFGSEAERHLSADPPPQRGFSSPPHTLLLFSFFCYHMFKQSTDVEESDFYVLIDAIFSLYEKACGLIKGGWCISEKLVHKCLHLICRMSGVSTVSTFL